MSIRNPFLTQRLFVAAALLLSTSCATDKSSDPPAPNHALREPSESMAASFQRRADLFVSGAFTVEPRGDIALVTADGGIRFGAPHVSRGGLALMRSRSPYTPSGARTLTRRDGGILERLDAQRSTLEQTWTFGSKPRGAGDLVVRIPVNASRAEERADGVHFPTSHAMYGVGTWIAANGTRTPITPSYEAGFVKLTVPASIVDGSAYPAVLDPILGPESEVPAAPGTEVLPASSIAASWVASYGSQRLFVWTDYRLRKGCLFGTRVASDGTVKDPNGLLISCATSSAAVVGFHGGNFEIVLGDQKGIVRVSSGGDVLDTTPVSGATFPGGGQILFDEDGPSQTRLEPNPAGGLDLYFTRMSIENGKTVVTDHLVMPKVLSSSLAQYGVDLKVAYSGNAYLFVGADQSPADGGLKYDTVSLRFDRNGTALGALQLVQSFVASDLFARADGPPLVSSPSGWLLARHTRNDFTEQDVTLWFFGLDGSVSAPKVITSQMLREIRAYEGGYVTSNYLATLQRWTADGTPVGPLVPEPNDEYQGGFSINGDSLDYLYSPLVGGGQHGALTLASLKSDLSVASETVLSRSGIGQWLPSVAFDGTKHLAVWTELHGTYFDESNIRAARVNADGTVESSVIIGKGHADSRPRVIFDGTAFFAVWASYDDVRAVRISTANQSTLPTPGTVLELGKKNEYTANEPDVASDGVNRLVITGSSNVNGKRVAIANDAILDPEWILLGGGFQTSSSSATVAFDGSHYLVTYMGSVDSNYAHVYGLLIDKDKPETVPPFLIYRGTSRQDAPQVISDQKHGFLVGWTDIATGSKSFLVRHVAGDATIGKDVFSLTSQLAADADPVALGNANDGVSYLATWRELKDGKYRVAAARVALDGTRLVDPETISVTSPSDVPIGSTSVSASTLGHALVMYERFDPSPASRSLRLFARSLQSGIATGDACSNNDQCATRYCADGVCCTTACNEGCGACNVNPGTCVPRGPSATCGPRDQFLCRDGSLACIVECATNADCKSGTCQAGGCVDVPPVGDTCSDNFTVLTKEGARVACGDFKCAGGVCRTKCDSVDDCRTGLICDFQGSCVPPPAAENDAGCSSVQPTRSLSVQAWRALGVGVTLLLRLRRRSRNERRSE